MFRDLCALTASLAIAVAPLLSGCASKYKKQEKAAEQMPVDCDTATGDIRLLRSEKAHVAEQIALGVTAIYPAGLVVGLLTRTEGTKLQVATGEYNKMLDEKIAQIQQECGVE